MNWREIKEHFNDFLDVVGRRKKKGNSRFPGRTIFTINL